MQQTKEQIAALVKGWRDSAEWDSVFLSDAKKYAKKTAKALKQAKQEHRQAKAAIDFRQRKFDYSAETLAHWESLNGDEETAQTHTDATVQSE